MGSKEAEARLRARFERVWNRQRGRVWRLAARLAADPVSADDLTQEVSIRAFQAFGSFRGECDPFTWLCRITINVVNRHFERKSLPSVSWSVAEVKELRADPRTEPERAALEAEVKPMVWAAMARLPEELRITLALVALEGMKYHEVARIMDVPIGTVKSRRHAAIQRLREELGEWMMGER